VKHWIAYEHVNGRPNHDAYVIVMAEDAEEAERQVAYAVAFEIPKRRKAEARLRTVMIVWELPEGDPRAMHMTDPLGWVLHGFEDA
jgi:hypothetical protein